MTYTHFKQCISDPKIRHAASKKIIMLSDSKVLKEEDMNFYLSQAHQEGFVDVIKGDLTVNQFVNRIAESYFGIKYKVLDDIAVNHPDIKNPGKIQELRHIMEMIYGKHYKTEDIMKKLEPH